MAAGTLNDVIKVLKQSDLNNQIDADLQAKATDELKDEIGKLNKMLSSYFLKESATKGDELEEKREKREKAADKQKSKNGGGPRSFGEGLMQGTGLGGLLGTAKDLAAGALAPFAGALGGATLSGLMGRALGKSFMGVAGFILGATYLDKWVDPLIDKITGTDDASIQTAMFGEIDISKLASGIGGALGLMFGPRLLGATVGSYFEKDAGTKGPSVRQKFLRRFGLAGILLTAASFAGDYVKGQNETLGNAVNASLTGAGIGSMFGIKGAIVGAIAGLIFVGLKGATDFLNGRRQETVEKFRKEFDTEIEAILASNEIEISAALAARKKFRELEKASRKLTGQMRADAERELAMRKAELDRMTVRAAEAEQDKVPVGQRMFQEDAARILAIQAQYEQGQLDKETLKDIVRPMIDIPKSTIMSQGLTQEDLVPIISQYTDDLVTPQGGKMFIDDATATAVAQEIAAEMFTNIGDRNTGMTPITHDYKFFRDRESFNNILQTRDREDREYKAYIEGIVKPYIEANLLPPQLPAGGAGFNMMDNRTFNSPQTTNSMTLAMESAVDTTIEP